MPRDARPALLRNLYVLDEQGDVQPATDFEQWCSDRTSNRHIALDTIGEVTVSTIFLGIDMNHFGEAAGPLVFETMAFHREDRQLMGRYTSMGEAIDGHQRMVAELRRTGGLSYDA